MGEAISQELRLMSDQQFRDALASLYKAKDNPDNAYASSNGASSRSSSNNGHGHAPTIQTVAQYESEPPPPPQRDPSARSLSPTGTGRTKKRRDSAVKLQALARKRQVESEVVNRTLAGIMGW